MQNTGNVEVSVAVTVLMLVDESEHDLRSAEGPLLLPTNSGIDIVQHGIPGDISAGEVRLTAHYQHAGRTLCYGYAGKLDLQNSSLEYVRGSALPC